MFPSHFSIIITIQNPNWFYIIWHYTLFFIRTTKFDFRDVLKVFQLPTRKCSCKNDTIAVYYMLFTLEWSPYREYLNFLTKELLFNSKQIWHVHSFVYVRSVILTVYYVKSNHNTDVDIKCSYCFFLSFWSIHFFVILGVEAGQCSYVVLNFDPNLNLNVLMNKVLIKKRVYYPSLSVIIDFPPFIQHIKRHYETSLVWLRSI